MNNYERTTTFSNRLNLARGIMRKHYGKVPIIVEGKNVINKTIVPRNMKFGEFIKCISERNLYDPNKTLIFLINKQLFPHDLIMGELYDDYKSKDEFLYVTWTEESSFG